MEATAVLGLLCLFFVFLEPSLEASVGSNESKYTTRYDHIDVDAILRSKRLLKNYMDCVMDKGPCTREGVELRKHLPDAIQTNCTKCSDRQKQWAGKIMSFLLQNHKDYWKQMLDKYDQDGRFRKTFEYNEDDDEDEDY